MSIGANRDQVRRFEKHVMVYIHDLYRAALRLTGQATDAEDLVDTSHARSP